MTPFQRPPTAFRFRPQVELLDDRITPALSFATQQIFTVGNGPFGVTTGDLNGDGRADIVTTNDVDGAVSILVNTTANGSATPTFAAKQDFTVVSGTGPVAVLVADLNGDGRPDIATANNAASVVAVLLNTTQAGAAVLTFASVQTFAVGAFPVDIKAGDFNGDGRSDLVVSDNGAGAGAGTTISVLLNITPTQSSAASFATRQTFPVGTGPRGVAVGDLNGDGRADIAVANSGSSNISGAPEHERHRGGCGLLRHPDRVLPPVRAWAMWSLGISTGTGDSIWRSPTTMPAPCRCCSTR